MEDLDLLIREVITVGPETSLKEAATLMADRLKTAVDWAEASCVCVEAGAVIGVITQANIVALVAAQHEWSTLRVSDLLRNQIGCDRTLRQDSGLLQVETAESLALLGQWFRQQRVSVLPVVDQAQHLVGLLTQDRLLQAFIQTVQSSQSAAQSPTVGAAQPESALLHSTQEHLASPTAELKQRIAAGTLLETITTHLHGSFQLEVPLQEVVIELHQFSKADRVLIYQFQADWSGQVVAEAVSPGWDGLLGQEITDPHFAEHRLEAYRQGHIQVTNDVLASGFSPCHLDLLRRLQVQALVVVPILWNDHLWGLLILQECAGPRAWNPFEVSLVQRVADHIAIALQQAARYQQSRQELQAHRQQEAHLLWHSQATELLASLAQKALQATDLNPLLDEVTQRVAQTLDLKFCGVLELLPNRAALLLRAGVGWPQNWIRQATVRADQRSQYGYTLAHHQPIAVRDLRLETRFSDTPFLHNLNIVSGVSTLIQGKNGPYGILSVHVHEQRDFSEAEITLMQSVADILAAVVKRHQTEEELAHFFELSLDLFCIASSEGLVQRVNARFETLLSYPEGALVGEPLVDIVHPEDRRATQEALYRLATGAPTVQFENRCHCCDDSYRWISWSVTLTGTGEKLFMVGRDITQEKQIALTLLEQQRQLSAITRNVPVGVYRFIYHCDGRISMPYASEAYQTLVGLSPSYLMAHPQALMALIQPEDRDELQGVIEKVQQTRTSQGIAEYRLQLPSGEIKWVSDRTHFSWNETGDLIVDGIHTDICDRKQFETALRVLNQNLEDIVELRTEELQQSNNRLRQEIVERELVEVALQNSQRFLELVLDSIPQAVFWKDRNGIYQGCNRNFAQDVGLASNEEIVGKCDRDLLWWDGQTEHYRQRERLILTTGNPELHIIEIQHQTDGQTRWLETSKVPLHDSNGHIIGILGSYEDITARIQAEEALQASQRFVQSIADTSPSILYIYDVQEKCNVYANQELVGTLGYSLEELQQLNQDIIPRLTHPDDHALVGKHHQQLSQAKDGEILEVEYRMRHANGKWRWLRSRDTVFSRNDEGQVKQIIGVALDISDRKRAEAEILRTLEREKELNALKSRFISMASHELRTPLTTILGSTELLQYSSHKWSEEKKQRHFEQIKNTVHHMTRLVDDVLLYSKVEADRSSCNPAPLDLVMFCQDLIEELTMSEAFPNRILLEAPDSGCEFPVDKHLLRQILVNLLGNSLKYSSSTTSVYLRINCQDNQVTLQIRDGGIGIPVQDIPYLYKSFHRGTNVGSIPGTGLGLPIVKRAVDMHQGQLIVESEESRGTLVTVILPCR